MGALSGYRVLDLSFFAPGRWATMMLGDLGADVVCVEMPLGTRPGSYSVQDDDTNSRWFWYQRNKRSVTLNLKKDDGAEIFRRLVEKADVVTESYKPGTATRLGVDYAAAKAINPAIVYCSVSGFGQTGPYAQLIAHEPNYQGFAGALGTNRAGDGPPHVTSAIVGDIGGANNAIVGILAALLHRERTGVGQYIDVSITAGIIPYLGQFSYATWVPNEYLSVSVSANLRPDFRAYRTKDDKYVAISPTSPWTWVDFCEAIERKDLIEQHQPTGAARDRLREELEEIFRQRTQEDWAQLNLEKNICVTPVYESITEVERDPQMIHREMVVEVPYEPLGTVKQLNIPFTMSETPPTVRHIPRYGQHTAEVLAELGYNDADVQRLRAEGVC